MDAFPQRHLFIVHVSVAEFLLQQVSVLGILIVVCHVTRFSYCSLLTPSHQMLQLDLMESAPLC